MPLILAAKLFSMEYEINYSEIIDIVKEEISREAAQAYSAEGVSLFDAIRWTSRDDNKSSRIMTEVLAVIKEQCNRFICCADLSKDNVKGEYKSLVFTLQTTPRRTEGREMSIATLLRSLAVNTFLNKYFVDKNQTESAAKYGELAVTDVKALTALLYTKMPPVYPV